MNDHHRDRTPADVMHVAERLRGERATATPLELDEIKLRAKRQAARRNQNVLQKGIWMKSRLALTLMIVLGLMMSGTGATLAISGSSGQGSAAQNAYPETITPAPPVQGVQQEQVPTEQVPTLGESQQGEEAPSEEAQPTAKAQPTRQVAAAAEGKQLPFTGFFTIPLMIAGVALLSTGVVLRKRAHG